MKKIISMICIFIFFFLSGCILNENIEDKMINSIEFWGDVSVYSIDIDSSLNNAIILSGDIQCFDNQTDLTLNNINEILLIGKNNKDIVISHDNINWNITKIEDGGKAIFELELNNINIKKSECLKFDEILFVLLDKTITKDLSRFYIQGYEDIKNRVSVIESPVATKNDIVVNEENMCTYRILSITPESNDVFDTQFLFPSELEGYINIKKIDVSRDAEMEAQVIEMYKDELTEKEKKYLKVFQVDCYYIVKKPGRMVFQPYISININGYYQIISPLVPLALSCK